LDYEHWRLTALRFGLTLMSELIETWRRIIIGEQKSWALFGKSNDMVIGLLGRSKRDLDAAGLTVIHIEDNRGVIAQ
jgi:hypothetical protein